MTRNRTFNPALRIVAVYLLLGCLWILFTDRIVYFVPDRGDRVSLQLLKGWFFVAISSCLLYFLVSRSCRRLDEVSQKQSVSDERTRLVLESINEGVWDWDLKSGKAYLSKRYYEIIEYSPDEIVPDFNFFRTLIHPDDRQRVLETVNEQLSRPMETSVQEFRIITGRGNVKWVQSHGTVVERDEDGRPLRRLGTMADITERKSIETELKDSEERYRTVVEDQTEVVCRFRPDNTLLLVNEAYCRVFGRSRDELIGSQWTPMAYPDDREMIIRKLAEISPANPVVLIENRVAVASIVSENLFPLKRIFMPTRATTL